MDSLASGWVNSIDQAQGLNEYVLQGLFGDTATGQPPIPTYSLSGLDDDVITAANQNADASIFGDAFFAQIGQGVLPAEKRNLWLLLTLASGGIPNPLQPTMKGVVSTSAR